MIYKRVVYNNIFKALIFSVIYFVVRGFIFHAPDLEVTLFASISGGFFVFLISIIFAKPIENRIGQ
ncbi:hypothetical protein [Bacillus sp. AFS041924]|uniref:hypothetical protein n=1 Tax=Bacillus sp. AFS041924 TaxID=2033503 RepID=UPI000BFD0DD3|nr:hypothetical protein [Bacillus sp. AFS041924]PGS49384.1 hypothetical protein COC46_15215 [Bacillus sp. AFS041924]